MKARRTHPWASQPAAAEGDDALEVGELRREARGLLELLADEALAALAQRAGRGLGDQNLAKQQKLINYAKIVQLYVI